MHILKNKAMASSHGKPCGEYRAILTTGKLGAIVRIEQPINGGWHSTGGGWYLSTLLCKPHDAISIDYGHQWSIDSGMVAIINEACKFCAKQLTELPND